MGPDVVGTLSPPTHPTVMSNRPGKVSSVVAAVSLCTASVLAQGADSCANAQRISGTGTFGFNTLKASTDGTMEAVEARPGVRQIFNDVWFAWRAPATAVYRITTCLPTNLSSATVMAVYRFGCPTTQGRAVAARGMNCRSHATIDLGTIAGTDYLIRIGHTVAENHGWGPFAITKINPPKVLTSAVYPGNGRTYHMLENSSWTVAQATARMMGGHLVTVNNKAENDWLQRTFLNWGNANRSLWLGYSDAESEGTWQWVSGELSTYTNWQSQEPSNGNQYEHYAIMAYDLQGGAWRDLLGFPDVGFFYKSLHGVVEVNDAKLEGTPAQIPVATGGRQTLSLNAGAAEGGAPYLLVGTTSGTIPGTTVGSLRVPINIDGYTLFTIASPNTLPLTNSMGNLDAAGKATATLTVPASPSLLGVTGHHAFVTFNSSRTAFVTASNAIAVYFAR